MSWTRIWHDQCSSRRMSGGSYGRGDEDGIGSIGGTMPQIVAAHLRRRSAGATHV
jgi:hypothetical protein